MELDRLLTPRATRFIPSEHLAGMNAPQRAFLLLGQITANPQLPVEALYGGAAGGGKSDALLMAALQYVDVPTYAALILRRTFKQLSLPDAIMARSKDWLKGSGAQWHEQRKQWTFPSGATLTFGHMQHEESKYDYQGAALQFVGFDELTQFTESQYLYLHSRTRRLEGVGVPIRVFSGSNPGGIGHGWVKKRFVQADSRDRGAVFIPARLRDNEHLDHETYIASLSHLGDVIREQLLNGDWGVFEGMAFANYDPKLHLVPPFKPPAQWLRFESHDHGVANPTATLAWASDYDGNLVTFDSYYQPGLVSVHAAAIKAKRAAWWPRDDRGWLTQSPLSFADPSMWARTGGQTKQGDPASVVTEYLDAEVDGFVRGNNDRKAGRLRLLELLQPHPKRPFPSWHPRAGEYGAPRWYIVGRRCPDLIEQLGVAPVNEEPVGQSIGAGEIVDPKWESAHGHAIAAARYGAMSWQSASLEPKPQTADPRAAAAQRIFEVGDADDEELDDLDIDTI